MSNPHSGVARWLSLATPESRVLLITAGCLALAVTPLHVLDGLPNLCLLERLTGYCPAHGTTHALAALLHGDLRRALAYNPNVLIVAPLLLHTLAGDLYRLLRRRPHA